MNAIGCIVCLFPFYYFIGLFYFMGEDYEMTYALFWPLRFGYELILIIAEQLKRAGLFNLTIEVT